MRLVKLLAYALLGYVAYEIFQGMRQSTPQRSRAGRAIGSRQLRRALNENAGRMNVTGSGRGTIAETDESTGAQMRHTVGRGVISA